MKIYSRNGHEITLVQVILFLLTFLTTLLAGFELAGVHIVAEFSTDLLNSLTGATFFEALTFSIPVLIILFSHEMGHYLTAKKFGVECSAPYFLPGIPIFTWALMPSIGTFGAFIQMSVDRISRWELLRIAAWGPIAGYVFAVPSLLVGMAMSPVVPVKEGNVSLGPTLLIMLGEHLFHPNIPQGYDVMLSPLAMAGWFGCFLTALNLCPIGQLDGGHIAYATFGKVWNKIGPILFGVLILLSIFSFAGWLIFALIVYKLGLQHPDSTSEEPLTKRQLWMSVSSLVMLVTTFTPAPFTGLSILDQVSKYL